MLEQYQDLKLIISTFEKVHVGHIYRRKFKSLKGLMPQQLVGAHLSFIHTFPNMNDRIHAHKKVTKKHPHTQFLHHK